MTPKERPRDERIMAEEMAWSHCKGQVSLLKLKSGIKRDLYQAAAE